MANEHPPTVVLSVMSDRVGASRRRRRDARRGRTAVAVVTLMLLGAMLAFVPGQAGAQGHFTDTSHHFGHDGINFLMDAGILGDPNSTWCGPSEFCPDRPAERWMAAVWLVRALSGGQDPQPVTETSFSDIGPDAFWAPHIEFLATLGLTEGYPDGEFKPFKPVSRQHMKLFMERGLDIEFLAENATALRHGGFVVYHNCNNGTYHCPSEPVSRGESAAMLAAGLQNKLNQRPTDAPEGIFWTIDEGISAGKYHTCALYHSGPNDDKIACWGLNPHGQLDNPNPDWRFKRVAAGGAHTCALQRNNRISCWGLNNHGQTDAPDGSYKNIAAGATNTCAIGNNNQITCWGNKGNGINNPPDHAFDNLDVGTNHACAIRRGSFHDSNRKRLHCWGSDTHGQIGRAPEHIPSDWRISQERGGGNKLYGRYYFGVSASTDYTCAAIYERYQVQALQSKKDIESQYRQCWGNNDRGQAPGRQETQIKEHMIDSGWWHTCAVKHDDARGWCWGDNSYRQHHHPDAEFENMTSGAIHSCAAKRDRSIACWGFEF